jgi:hypothetical protein
LFDFNQQPDEKDTLPTDEQFERVWRQIDLELVEWKDWQARRKRDLRRWRWKRLGRRVWGWLKAIVNSARER